VTDPFSEEQIEVLRRIAERGLAHAQMSGFDDHWAGFGQNIDLWQHMLDEIGRLNPSS
jgi:hypothetical protein